MALTNFSTAEIGQRAINAAGAILAPITAFSFQVEGATRNKSILVPIVGAAQTAADFNESTNDYFNATGAADESTVSVALTKDLKSTFSYTLGELDAITPEVFQGKVLAAITSVASGCMSFIQGKILAAAFTNTANTTALATFGYDDVIDLRASVESAMGVFGMPLTLICGATRYNALRKDSSLATLFANAGNIDPVAGVYVPTISGTRIIQSVVPTNGENLQAYICDPSAIAVAMGYESYMGENDTLLTDPVTGITMKLHEEKKPGSQRVYWTVEALIGAVAANGKALTRNAAAT